MTSSRKLLVALSILTAVALACGMSFDLGTKPAASSTSTISGLDQVSTVVAQTLQAYTQQAPTPTLTVTVTPTPVFSMLTLTVSADTDCTSGPGSSFSLVITLHPGTIAVPVGRDTVDNFWLIETPNNPGSTCWVPGVYASVTGDVSRLPEATPSAAAAVTYTLSEPRSLNVSCSSQAVSSSHEHHNEAIWTVDLRWKNTEPNAYWVLVYRNGRQIARLGPHGTSITDEFRHERRRTVTYGVQAIKGSEVSSIVTIDVRHCPGD
jgi:hypothetical protein